VADDQVYAKLALENAKRIFTNIYIFIIQVNTYANFAQLDKICGCEIGSIIQIFTNAVL
jgi:hypothetical protein